MKRRYAFPLLLHRTVPAPLIVATFMLVMFAIAPVERAAARRVADLDIPLDARADDPTLQKAVDAYRQARTLDSQLKRSERAVERQTRQLRKGKRLVALQLLDDARFACVALILNPHGRAEADQGCRRDCKHSSVPRGGANGRRSLESGGIRDETRQALGAAGRIRDEGELRKCASPSGVVCMVTLIASAAGGQGFPGICVPV